MPCLLAELALMELARPVEDLVQLLNGAGLQSGCRLARRQFPGHALVEARLHVINQLSMQRREDLRVVTTGDRKQVRENSAHRQQGTVVRDFGIGHGRILPLHT